MATMMDKIPLHYPIGYGIVLTSEEPVRFASRLEQDDPNMRITYPSYTLTQNYYAKDFFENGFSDLDRPGDSQRESVRYARIDSQ